MKVKFKYGIKSFSGTHDEMVFANYATHDVVIGRMLPRNGEITANQVSMGNKMQNIASFFKVCSAGFKSDLDTYATKFSALPGRLGTIGVNKFSIFLKICWAASQAPTNPIDLDSLTADDIAMGSYSMIDNVAVCVNNGFLPAVEGYELLTTSLG